MMRYITAVLVLLFLIFAIYVSQPDFYKKFAGLNDLDWVAILYLPIAVLFYKYCSKYLREGRLNNRDIFWVFVAISTIVVVCILVFLTTTETAVAIVLAAYCASLGWIYTNYVNTNIQRKAHTMNVLVQLRNSTEFNKARSILLGKFPFGRPITTNDLGGIKADRANVASYASGGMPVIDAAYYIANYFEFISVGCMNHDLDPPMIENTLRGILVNWFNHLEPVIHDARVESNGAVNERVFRNYIAMVEYYKSKKFVR